MPQARCDVACTTLEALLVNAAQVTTLLLLQFEQQYLAKFNSQAHLFPHLPQDLTSYYTYHNPPPGPTSWPEHPWVPTRAEGLRYATPYWNHVAEYTEYKNTDLQPAYPQYHALPCEHVSSWPQPPVHHSPTVGAAAQQVTPLPHLAAYEADDSEPPTIWDSNAGQHVAEEATAAPLPTEDMTPCALNMFPLATNTPPAWIPVPKEPPCVILHCTPPPESSVHDETATLPFLPVLTEPPRAVSRWTPPPGSCVHNEPTTASFSTPIGHVRRQSAPASSTPTHGEEPPPLQSTSEEYETESHTEFPYDPPYTTANVFETLRVLDTPRRPSTRNTCEHVNASTPQENKIPAGFTTIVHRPHRRRPSCVPQHSVPSVPAVCRRRRRLGNRKHPRMYGRKKGSQFCRSRPACTHEVCQYGTILPPTFVSSSCSFSMNDLCLVPASTDSAGEPATPRSFTSRNDRLPGRF